MSRSSKLAVAAGVGVSLGVHALVLLLAVAPPSSPQRPRERVQVQVVRPAPPPPLPPKPVEPPREKAHLSRRPVAEPTPATPPPLAATAAPTVIAGLSATSFSATGAVSAPVGGGVAAPVAGPASPDGGGPGGGVDEPARVRSKPTLVVPDAARAARVEGSWTILVDVDAAGRPRRARPAEAIGWGLDDACVEAWMRSTWRAARAGGVPVASADNPVRCTVKETR